MLALALAGGSLLHGAPGRLVLRQAWTHAVSGAPSAAVSADGRYVAFVSAARLLPADTNLMDDIYLLERESGQLSLATPSHTGAAADGTSLSPQLSDDGRYLAFDSAATILTATPDRNGDQDVFVRDRATGTTRRVSLGPAGEEANGRSGSPALSGDGRWIAFESAATNLVPGEDANGSASDVYLLHLATGAIARVSVDAAGRQFGRAFSPRISADGRFVSFTAKGGGSDAGARADAAAAAAVHLRDTTTGTTVCVSCGRPDRGAGIAAFASDISADGQVVVFAVQSPPDRSDIAVHDRAAGTTTVITRRANSRSTAPRLSGDGRVVVFESWASNLLCSWRCRTEEIDDNLLPDVYLFDRASERFRRVSGRHGAWWAPSLAPRVDRLGTLVVFSSRESFGPEDVTADFDLFVCAPVCS
jgi:Tol biopolymer transport system component